MLIKYSPDFAGDYYLKLNEDNCLYDQTVLNDIGLLEAFELRLGLPSAKECKQIRIIAYRNVLDAFKDDSFYEQSFAVDSFGVAANLLSWRDTLLLQGWNPEKKIGQKRIDTLSLVECSFRKDSDYLGVPDRWINVLAEMEAGHKAFSGDDTIEVWYSKDLLPALIWKAISLSGAEVMEMRPSSQNGVDFTGKDVEVRRYTELTDAFEAFALESQPEGTVFINRDNYRFNSILRRYGLALEGSSIDNSNPSIPQIFKLGLQLLNRPINPHTLLSYLNLSISPLPAHAASALAKALLKDNGVGEEWRKTLDELSKEKRDKVDKYLIDLLKDRSDSAIPTENAKKWCKEILKWSEGRIHDEDNPISIIDSTQFASLSTSCRGMIRLLESAGETFNPIDFNNIIKSLYDSVSIPIDSGELGSFCTVSSPAGIISNPDKLIWLDCNGALDVIWPYAFLTIKEVEALKENGVEIPSRDLYFRYTFSCMTGLLSSVNNIVLVRSEYDCGEPLREHPAVTLALQAGIKETRCLPPQWNGKQVVIPSREAFEFGKDMLGKFARKESASSIEKLIENPVDYYLEYVLRLKDVKDVELADVIPTRGVVAHLTFENLMRDGNKDVAAMRKLVNSPEFYERVREAATLKGAILLLNENEIDFEGFVVTLKDSFNTLLDILEDSSLQPYGTEVSLQDKDGKGVVLGSIIGEVTGFVDLIAQTLSGEFVVIDLKYPRASGSFYINKLQQDKSVQLELYSKAISIKLGKPVVATAYYLIPLMELHTCDLNGMFKGNGIFHEPVKKNYQTTLEVWIEDKIKESRESFVSGKIALSEPSTFTFGRQSDTFEILKDRIK